MAKRQLASPEHSSVISVPLWFKSSCMNDRMEPQTQRAQSKKVESPRAHFNARRQQEPESLRPRSRFGLVSGQGKPPNRGCDRLSSQHRLDTRGRASDAVRSQAEPGNEGTTAPLRSRIDALRSI